MFITDHFVCRLTSPGVLTPGQRTTLRFGWLGDAPVSYIPVISPWEMGQCSRIMKGELERKIGVIPRNQPKALALKAFSEKIQIEIEGLQSTLLKPLSHFSC